MTFTRIFKDFLDFIRTQGVVGLAIGFILGGSTSKVVASLVQDIIQPIIGLLFGSTHGLRSLSIGPITYGNFLSNVIDFIIMAAVVWFVFKRLRFEVLDKKKE